MFSLSRLAGGATVAGNCLLSRLLLRGVGHEWKGIGIEGPNLADLMAPEADQLGDLRPRPLMPSERELDNLHRMVVADAGRDERQALDLGRLTHERDQLEKGILAAVRAPEPHERRGGDGEILRQ